MVNNTIWIQYLIFDKIYNSCHLYSYIESIIYRSTLLGTLEVVKRNQLVNRNPKIASVIQRSNPILYLESESKSYSPEIYHGFALNICTL